MSLRGQHYGVKIGLAGASDGDFINCELASTLTISRDMVNKSGSAGGAARHYRYGYYTWQVEVEMRSFLSLLKGSMNNLIVSQLDGTELEVFITNRISNTQEMLMWGTVLIPNLTVSFPNTGYSTTTVTLQGTGELQSDFSNFLDIINSMPYDEEKDLVIDTGASS